MKPQFRKLLEENPKKTCLILKNNEITFTSEEKGVQPMMDYYRLHGESLEPLIVIDRIVGKGALMLAKMIGADYVVTPVVSEIAFKFAEEQNIKVEYTKMVPYIINRAKDGQCPIETSLIDVEDIYEGYERIKETLLNLRGNK
ncbi:MAG: DUF1893 domain-containing protein [Clostridiales bacterium]|nr:DUF1893 domain-containing protein [Clostridiales bacterium]